MSRVLSGVRACLFVAACTALSLGCGKGGGSGPDNVPVSGKVTVDGQPVTAGQVSFTAFDKDMKVGGISAGEIDPNGGYVLYTNSRAGAPPGRYKVTVTPKMIPTGDNKMPSIPFNPKYSDQSKTPLVVEVKANPEPGAYDLKLTK